MTLRQGMLVVKRRSCDGKDTGVGVRLVHLTGVSFTLINTRWVILLLIEVEVTQGTFVKG